MSVVFGNLLTFQSLESTSILGNMTDNTTPDSWETVADASLNMSRLNVNAAIFVPNVNAPEFVPSFLKESQPVAPGKKLAEIFSCINL